MAGQPLESYPGSQPALLHYGSRIGVRSCAEQRYIAAFWGEGDFSVEVSGFHPLRQDAADPATECPSEWLLLQFHSHKHRGVVHLGDQVCFVRELGEKRSSKERYAYLALEPTADGTMELVVERREVSDSCCWTLLHADGDAASPLQSHMPLLIRGKYNDCLAVGSHLRGVSPARASGRHLICKGRDGRVPELRFRIVKAGIPLDARETQVEHMEYPAPAILADGDLGQKSLAAQEQMLLDDLLFCLQGVEGAYIHKSDTAEGARFTIEIPAGADVSTAQFLQQMMPLCNHHAFVEMFVEQQSRHEYGAVNHALCSALGELLREFAMKVSHLEQSLQIGELSLAELWYRSQPSMDTFALLYRVTSHVQGLKGGAVLNGIEEVMMKTGLTSAQSLCEFLLQKASRPYFDMMSLWVYEGRLEDPYNEFFVSENFRRDEQTKRTGPAADFWQKHFTIDERAVPQFLASSRERILHAGKYLHVFFSASPSASLPEPLGGRVPFQYSRKRRDYAEAIDSAYRRSASALLNLFMRPQPEGLDLPGRLKSLRSFFFLSKADWFGHFLDTSDLERPAEEVPLARLDGLLDLAVRASSMAADPFREDISCGLHSFRVEDACHRMVKGSHEEDKEDAASVASGISSIAGLGVAGEGSGVRSLTLKYRTAWPLSILFSKTILLKYQVIFRHLLYCRYVERKLVEVWVDHQYTKELGLDSSFSPYYSLRQRMLHFCRDYIYYATVEVLEPQSHEFLASLSGAETIDDVLYRHEQFLEGCLREVLLTEHDNLYRHLSKVLQTCLTFAHNLRRFSHSIGGEPIEEPEDGKTPAERRLTRVRHSTQKYLALLSQRHYSKMMAKWKTIFESQLQAFLRQIQQETKARYEHFLKNLATRLDYNEYYSTVLSSGPEMFAPPER